jgi:hypothetical protein
MQRKKTLSHEMHALERVAGATREVFAASTALEANFGQDGVWQPSTFALARFAAAMQGLKDARVAFDSLVSLSTEPRCWLTAPSSGQVTAYRAAPLTERSRFEKWRRSLGDGADLICRHQGLETSIASSARFLAGKHGICSTIATMRIRRIVTSLSSSLPSEALEPLSRHESAFFSASRPASRERLREVDFRTAADSAATAIFATYGKY